MTQLYTFVLEYAGGTYVSQYRGETLIAAMQSWSSAEQAKLAGQWSGEIVELLFERLGNNEPVRLDGLQHVWCVSASVSSDLALLNIVVSKD